MRFIKSAKENICTDNPETRPHTHPSATSPATPLKHDWVIGTEVDDFIFTKLKTAYFSGERHEYQNQSWIVLFSIGSSVQNNATILKEIEEIRQLEKQFLKNNIKTLAFLNKSVISHDGLADLINGTFKFITNSSFIHESDTPAFHESITFIDDQRTIKFKSFSPSNCPRNFSDLIRIKQILTNQAIEDLTPLFCNTLRADGDAQDQILLSQTAVKPAKVEKLESQSGKSSGSGFYKSVGVSGKYDFRSDTFTKPNLEMRLAMSNAEVGDDVFAEDPTVNKLESMVLSLANMEAAMFCASSTMTNQIAVRTHLTQPPYSVLCDVRSHVLNYEASGISFHCGAGTVPVTPKPGFSYLTADIIEANLILDDDVHHSPTRLICLENTLAGEIMPLAEIKKISALAKRVGIPLHLDGARLWNASVETGISIAEYCSFFDSVNLCLSKGLGSPVGAILLGSAAFIKKARHFRKLYGGGWRQAGILAQGAIHAITHVLPTFKTSHQDAKFTAVEITKLGFKLTKKVETNMVWFESKLPNGTVLTADELAIAVGKFGCVLFGGRGSEIRLVFHHQIDREGCELLVKGMKAVVDMATGGEYNNGN